MSNSSLRPSMLGIFLQFLREGLIPPRRHLTDKQINNRRGWWFMAIGAVIVLGLLVATVMLTVNVSGWFGFGWAAVALAFGLFWGFLSWYEREYPC